MTTNPIAGAMMTDDDILRLVAEKLGNPLLFEDLKEDFTVHTEAEDWIKFARALLSATQPTAIDGQEAVGAEYRCRKCGDAAEIKIRYARAGDCCRKSPCERAGKGPCDIPARREPANSISDAMMDLVDRLGHEWKDVDPRAWSRLLIYAPLDKGASKGGVPIDAYRQALHEMQAEVSRNKERRWLLKLVEERAQKLLAASPATPSADAQDERGAFKAWASRYTNFPEKYDSIPSWLAWQARAALQSPAQYDPHECLGTGGHAAMLLLAERCGISKDTTNAAVIRFALACRDDAAPAQSAEPVAWVDEKAEVLVFGGWDKQPFAKSWRPVFYAAPQPAQTAKSAVVPDDERAAFEAWWTQEMNLKEMDLHRCQFPMTPDHKQPYACPETQRSWLTWQASAASPPPVAQISPIIGTQAPFSNCRFKFCDLPGQCRDEGKCHHPAVAAAQPVAQTERALTEKQVTCTHPVVCPHAFLDDDGRWNCAKCMTAAQPGSGAADD